jgi:hypothetical protein
MYVGRGETSRQVKLEPGQLMTPRVISDEHVHEWVIESDEPNILRGCYTGERATVLGKDAHPALLPGRQRTVVQNDNLPALRLPTPRSDLGSHCAEVVAVLTQLMAAYDGVLQLGQSVKRGPWRGRDLRHSKQRAPRFAESGGDVGVCGQVGSTVDGQLSDGHGVRDT